MTAAPPPGDGPAATEGSLRLDKWLWQARFFKSRGLASRLCATGRLRLSGKVVTKAHQAVRPGDVLTFPQGLHIRVIRVVALGVRRGPAPEARTLYDDLDPPVAKNDADTPPPPAVPRRDPGTGRPTKRERRALDRLTPDEES